MHRRGSLSRREFAKAAVAIGGTSALAACLDRQGPPDLPRGPEDTSTLPERQHAWTGVLSTDDHGNAVAPRHHVLLLLDYARDGPATDDDRAAVSDALTALERAYPRGNDGLLFTLGYSPAYFDRYDASLPSSVDLPEPTALSPFEEPELDAPDAVLHVASDHAQVVLAVEEALLGDRGTLNGVGVPGVAGVFERVDRRTGFVGRGLPAENQDVAGVPDGDHVSGDAPLYMGFKSGFTKNQASEDRVTVPDGPFAGGTTQHVSRLRLRLEDWYVEQDHDERVAEMFCPVHAEEGRVEGTGESLGDSTGMDDDCVDAVREHARSYGRIGHSQKTAAAREEDSPRIIRRDFDSTDDGEAGLHFVAVQRTITDFEETRKAMNGTEFTDEPAIRQRVNNGILEYTFVKRRGNYLLPPRSLRALPPASPDA